MNPVYYCGWRFFRTAYKLYCRAEWFNAERVPKTGPVILASNHASIIDPPLVGTGLHRGISYLARESLFRFWGVGWVLRNWDAVPVDRDGGGARGLKAIIDRLLAGGGIILFPEGTRTRPGQPLKMQRGAAQIALRGGLAITPVHIHCEPLGLFKGQPWWRVATQPLHFSIRVGEDMPAAPFLEAAGGETSLAARRLTERLIMYFTESNKQDTGISGLCKRCNTKSKNC